MNSVGLAICLKLLVVVRSVIIERASSCAIFDSTDSLSAGRSSVELSLFEGYYVDNNTTRRALRVFARSYTWNVEFFFLFLFFVFLFL